MLNIFYIIISLIILISTVYVLIARNPVHSVFFLILVFCGISILIFTLDVTFLAIIFIIVYVGAIAVLFLFVIMMLNIKYLELNENFIRYLPIIFIIISIFLIQFLKYFTNDLLMLINFKSDLYLEWINILNNDLNILNIGYLIYNHYSIIFILASIILLIAMLGSIVLTLNKNYNIRRQDISHQVLRRIDVIVSKR